MSTVKEHAARIAENVARGAEARVEYSDTVRDNDLTVGECAALRVEIDRATTARLRELQKVADASRAALRAVQKIFERDVTFVGGGPESHVRVPFESHDQSWNHWHEARDIIRAALASE